MGTPELTRDVALLHHIMAVKLPVLLVCGAVLNPSQKGRTSHHPSIHLLPLFH